MLDMDAHARLMKVWTGAALDCAWTAIGVATTMAESATQLWAAALQSPAARPLPAHRPQHGVSNARSWYRSPLRSPFEDALAFTATWPVVTAWQDMLGPSRGWWTFRPFGLGPAAVCSPWGAAAASAWSATPWVWPAPLDPWRQIALLWQPAGFLPLLPASNPYSVYRTDGGHASAQITLPRATM
jgi:hypothetical protein